MLLGASFRGGAIVAVVLGAIAACAHGSDDPFFDVGTDAATTDGSKPGEGGLPLPTPERDAGEESDSGEEVDADQPCTRRLAINELMTRGSNASVEFVELFNPNPCAVAIGGYRLVYKSSSGAPATGTTLLTFAAGTSIPAKGFFVVGTPSFTGSKNVEFNGGLADDGQVALFEDGSGGVKVDSVGYGSASGDYIEGSAAPKPSANGSIARRSDGVDTNNNNADFEKAATPSPGAPN